MTVADLIEELKKERPEAVVLINDAEGETRHFEITREAPGAGNSTFGFVILRA